MVRKLIVSLLCPPAYIFRILIVETELGLYAESGIPSNSLDASPEADLVDSTKKMKLTDKIKGKLHIGKKSSSG